MMMMSSEEGYERILLLTLRGHGLALLRLVADQANAQCNERKKDGKKEQRARDTPPPRCNASATRPSALPLADARARTRVCPPRLDPMPSRLISCQLTVIGGRRFPIQCRMRNRKHLCTITRREQRRRTPRAAPSLALTLTDPSAGAPLMHRPPPGRRGIVRLGGIAEAFAH